VIWGIGIFFITTIVGLIAYAFGQIDWSQPDSGMMSDMQVNMNWGQFFTSTYMNVFIMVNIVLGLMLLDMYFTKKKNERMQKHA